MSNGARTRRRPSTGAKVSPLYPAVGFAADAQHDVLSGLGGLVGLRVHMIGIGGCGMSGAAGVLLREGALVSGSDRAQSGALMRLTEAGANVHVGQRGENIPAACDLVVHSAAIDEANPELMAAQERGIRVMKYAQLLGLLMTRRKGVAVAGTHGKSTTTAMITYVMREAGCDPSYVIGAGVEQLGSGAGVGDGDHFIVEACEYDRSFLNLRPMLGTILNVDEDHLDYYKKGLPEIVEAFGAFASLVPAEGVLIVNGEDRNVLDAVEGVSARVETFGFKPGFDWQAELGTPEQGCHPFRVMHDGEVIAEVKLAIPGRHNVANALAAMAICMHAGVEPDVIARHLGTFRGAVRRLTRRGEVAGVTVVDDYAHHPKEIQVTLRAARDFYNPRRLFVVFQPHQHSRTRFLLHDFAMSFGAADTVIVPDIYFVRDSAAEVDRIGASDLVEQIHLHGGEARHEPDFDRIAAQLCQEVQAGDLVVTMGAGDVWRVADSLLNCLKRTRNGERRAGASDAVETSEASVT